MSTQAVVLLNPLAGGGRARALRQPIQRWLTRYAPGVPLLAPDNAEAARATLMVMAPRTRVVLVGGDGSLHHMLPAVLRCGHRVGFVPAGRHNEFATVLGLAGLGWEEALRYALHAPVVAVDVAQISVDQITSLFVTRLLAGQEALHAQLLHQGPAWLAGPGWAGRLGDRWAGLRAGLGNTPFALRLWVNGRLQHDAQALGLAVANSPDPRTRLGSSLVDAVFETRVRATTGRHALLWARSRPQRFMALAEPPQPGGETQVPLQWGGAGKILVDAARPLHLMADGEVLPRSSRFSIRCLPRSLYVAGHVEARGSGLSSLPGSGLQSFPGLGPVSEPAPPSRPVPDSRPAVSGRFAADVRHALPGGLPA